MERSDINRPSWNEYFMMLAYCAATRSPDVNTKVGAVLANSDNYILSTGYNGLPHPVINNDLINWAREGSLKNTKYPYVIHAELNALLSCKNMSEIKNNNVTLYTTLYPCHECAKAIVQAGISQVIYASDKYHETESAEVARRIFELTRVHTQQIKINKDKIIGFLNEIIEV